MRHPAARDNTAAAPVPSATAAPAAREAGPASALPAEPLPALAHVCAEILTPAEAMAGVEPVSAGAVPAPFDELLVHNEHMTVVLERFHRRPIELRVPEHVERDMRYARRIVLTLEGTDRVVEFGIVRIDLSLMPGAVRSEIVARQRPLGEILIRHDVLREIVPHAYYRFAPHSVAAGALRTGAEGPIYGRVGTICCDGAPAIELLEAVCGPVDDSTTHDGARRGAGTE